MPEREVITLYLAGWQKRMIMDHVKTRSLPDKIKVFIKDRKQWVMYIIPDPLVMKGAWNLYLTDEQIVKVQEVTGLKTKISALTITPELLKSGSITFG